MELVPQSQFQIDIPEDLKNNLYKLYAKLQECVLNFEAVGNRVIQNLKQLQEEIIKFETENNYYRTGNTVAGATSSALTAAGLACAFSTLGLSLFLSGLGIAIGSTVSTVAVEYKDYSKTTDLFKVIELIYSELEAPKNSLKDIVEIIEIAIPKMAESVNSHHGTYSVKDGIVQELVVDSGRIIKNSTVAIVVKEMVTTSPSLKAATAISAKAVRFGLAFAVLDIGLLIYSWSKKHKAEEIIDKLIVLIREEINKWKSYLKELQVLYLAHNSYMLWEKLQTVLEREKKQQEEYQQMKEEFEDHKRQMKQDADEREGRMKEEFEESKRQMNQEANERERRIIQHGEVRERQMNEQLNEVKSLLNERGTQIEEIYKMIQDNAANKNNV